MSNIRPTSRDAILEAAFQLFNEKPTASLGDIAERAGVGRATLHRHFSSREQLMIALAHSANTELNEAIEKATADAASHTEALRQTLTAIVPLANRQWFLANETVDTDPTIKAAYQADRKQLLELIRSAQSEGTFAEDVPALWIAQSYENLIYAAWSMVRDDEVTASQAADLAWRTLTTGLNGGTK